MSSNSVVSMLIGCLLLASSQAEVQTFKTKLGVAKVGNMPRNITMGGMAIKQSPPLTDVSDCEGIAGKAGYPYMVIHATNPWPATSRCFFLLDTKVTCGSWDTARVACNNVDQKKARLAYVETDDFANILKPWLTMQYEDMLPQTGWWIGLLHTKPQYGAEHGWSWMTAGRLPAKQAINLPWIDGEPNGSGACGNLWYDKQMDKFGINDDACQSKFGINDDTCPYAAICEIVL